MPSTITIRRATFEEMERHAREAYPEECCGAVLAGADGEWVRRITNVQNRLHAEDPALHPRDARIAYFMEPKELYAVLREADDAHRPILLFYHSHPEHGAYFSDEDKARALAWDEPAYPGAAHLVLSVVGAEVKDHLLVAWDETKRDFLPIRLNLQT